MTYTTDYYNLRDDENDERYRYKYEIGNVQKLESAIYNLSICIEEIADLEVKEELKYYFHELINEIQSIEYEPKQQNNDSSLDDEDCIPF